MQPVTIGVDSGAKHMGIAIATEDKVLVKGTIELRQDVKENLILRAIRRGRRQRKTRYRKARFLNRKKKEGWLPPSIQSRVDNQIHWIETFKSLLPSPIGLLRAVYLPPNFLRKAEAARSESQDAHAQGGEALFSSSEGAKRPKILAARAGQQRKAEVARSECEGDGASDVEVFFTS